MTPDDSVVPESVNEESGIFPEGSNEVPSGAPSADDAIGGILVVVPSVGNFSPWLDASSWVGCTDGRASSNVVGGDAVELNPSSFGSVFPRNVVGVVQGDRAWDDAVEQSVHGGVCPGVDRFPVSAPVTPRIEGLLPSCTSS